MIRKTAQLRERDVAGLVAADAVALGCCFLDAYVENLVDGKARLVERATAEGMVRDLLRDLRMRARPTRNRVANRGRAHGRGAKTGSGECAGVLYARAADWQQYAAAYRAALQARSAR
ncbi:MAG TPA: hypothetical protein VGF27_00860 [Pseudoduganella sp.]